MQPEPAGAGPLLGLRDRAEEWIYTANERNHWLFGVYDRFNEAWARVAFRGLRRRARDFDRTVRARGRDVRLRRLREADLDAFAELLSSFDFPYRPPHALDPAAARRALRRRSYIPLGIFAEERLLGYLLIRLFFPRRAVSGIWSRREAWNRGFGTAVFRAAGDLTEVAGVPAYSTVPLDNVYSVRMAESAGFRVIRSNRRFHVLRRG